MHTRTLQKLALALTLFLALHTSTLRAQILGPYGTSPTVFEVDANGLLSDTGTEGTGTLSLSGAGTRMFWYPGKAAFRAGGVAGTEWNDSSIGAYSMAFGYKTTASGYASFAAGYNCQATTGEAVAIGKGTLASGGGSFALGWATTASNYFDTATGYNNISSGGASFSAGGNNSAVGNSSFATGSYTSAVGDCSTTMGQNSYASGYASLATGMSNSGGEYSVAMGANTYSSSYAGLALGMYNVGHSASGGTPSLTAWVATDPLLELGNGTSSTHSDALVVYKNGNAAFQGIVNVAPVPDIPMYNP